MDEQKVPAQINMDFIALDNFIRNDDLTENLHLKQLPGFSVWEQTVASPQNFPPTEYRAEFRNFVRVTGLPKTIQDVLEEIPSSSTANKRYRWKTPKEALIPFNHKISLTKNGVERSILDWAKDLNIPPKQIAQCLSTNSGHMSLVASSPTFPFLEEEAIVDIKSTNTYHDEMSKLAEISITNIQAIRYGKIYQEIHPELNWPYPFNIDDPSEPTELSILDEWIRSDYPVAEKWKDPKHGLEQLVTDLGKIPYPKKEFSILRYNKAPWAGFDPINCIWMITCLSNWYLKSTSTTYPTELALQFATEEITVLDKKKKYGGQLIKRFNEWTAFLDWIPTFLFPSPQPIPVLDIDNNRSDRVPSHTLALRNAILKVFEEYGGGNLTVATIFTRLKQTGYDFSYYTPKTERKAVNNILASHRVFERISPGLFRPLKSSVVTKEKSPLVKGTRYVSKKGTLINKNDDTEAYYQLANILSHIMITILKGPATSSQLYHEILSLGFAPANKTKKQSLKKAIRDHLYYHSRPNNNSKLYTAITQKLGKNKYYYYPISASPFAEETPAPLPLKSKKGPRYQQAVEEVLRTCERPLRPKEIFTMVKGLEGDANWNVRVETIRMYLTYWAGERFKNLPNHIHLTSVVNIAGKKYYYLITRTDEFEKKIKEIEHTSIPYRPDLVLNSNPSPLQTTKKGKKEVTSSSPGFDVLSSKLDTIIDLLGRLIQQNQKKES